ncbi:MAG: hypothetical protein M3O22_07855 [Pseudomonadota bacterium]|nr:hypothetical protein [Pseudomonadota bacterium]
MTSSFSGNGTTRLHKNYLPLGTVAAPFPMMGVTDLEVPDGSGGTVRRKGNVLWLMRNDKAPLPFYTARPKEEALAILMREIPSPSLLPGLVKMIEQSAPDSKNRIILFLGEHGTGKTRLAEVFAKASDSRPPVFIDCGGRNLFDLFYETVLDSPATLRSAVDKYLQQGQLSPIRIAFLQQGLGQAFEIAADGKTCRIVWDSIGTPPPKKNKDDIVLDSMTLSKWALDCLEHFCSLEGIQVGGSGNALGLQTREGPIIRAWKEDRQVILDEYTKGQKGTDNAYQTFLQFMNGERDWAVIKNRLSVNGQEQSVEFRFDRRNMGSNFRISLTGNKSSDGPTTVDLSASAYSRIPVVEVEKPSRLDWTQSASYILTGVPLSTWATLYKFQAEKDKPGFAREMVAMLTAARSPEEMDMIPAVYAARLGQWEQTLEAARNLAEFYKLWTDVTTPDSELLSQGNMVSVATEIDRPYSAMVAMGFRRFLQHIGRAGKPRAEVDLSEPVSLFSMETALKSTSADVTPATTLAHFGTNLHGVIMEEIMATTKGKPATQGWLLENLDRLFDPVTARRLDIDPFVDLGGEAAFRALHRLVNWNAGNQTGKAVALSETAVAQLLRDRVAEVKKAEVAGESVFVTLSGNRDAKTGLAWIQDMGKTPGQIPAGIKVSDFLPADIFAASLVQGINGSGVLDIVRKGFVWKDHMKDKPDFQRGAAWNESLEIVDGNHSSGVHVNTFFLQYPGLRLTDPQDPARITLEVPAHTRVAHIVEKKGPEGSQILLVADGIPETLADILKSQKITVVERSAPGSAAKTDRWVREVLGDGKALTDSEIKKIIGAFTLRNVIPVGVHDNGLGNLLTGRDMKVVAPVIIRTTPAPKDSVTAAMTQNVQQAAKQVPPPPAVASVAAPGQRAVRAAAP